MDNIIVRQATPEDTAAVRAVLSEAAEWLNSRGIPLWRAAELEPDRLAADVAAGLFYIALVREDVAGTLIFQLEDPLSWPDDPPGEAAYLHRLAVRRAYAGGAVSGAILDWAARRAAALGRTWLRLDCEAARPRLRAMYERFGFRHHSDSQVGPYAVARYQRAVTPLD